MMSAGLEIMAVKSSFLYCQFFLEFIRNLTTPQQKK